MQTSDRVELSDETVAKALSGAEAQANGDDARKRALAYARGRYGAGLGRYVNAIDALDLPHGDVLDVGCGVGPWTVALAAGNDQVVAFDLRQEYIDVASLVADQLGLGERVRFRTGTVERLEEPAGSLDAVLCHMVMMWVPERELGMTEFARVLKNDGLLYVAYTTHAMDVRRIASAEGTGDWERARPPASVLLSSSLYELGAFQYGTRVRSFRGGELERSAELHGFRIESTPHVEDGPHEWRNMRTSGDFLARKVAEAGASERNALSGLSTAERAARLRLLIDDGAPRLALRLLEEFGVGEEDKVRLRMAAALKIGDVDTAAGLLDDLRGADSARLRGIYHLERGDHDEAAREFGRMEEDRDAHFLLGAATLAGGDSKAAAEHFHQELEADSASSRSLAGAVIAALDGGDHGAVPSLLAAFAVEQDGPTASSQPDQPGFDELPDTSQPVHLDVHDDESIHYSATHRTLVNTVFEHLEVGPEDVFVDLGCGKGRMVLAAAMHPFKRIVGVELGDELAAVARENVERNRERMRCQDVEIVTHDASAFSIPDDATVLYLYNPFKGEVFRQALANILASLDRHPRPLKLVYMLPWGDQIVRESGRFDVVERVPIGEGPLDEIVYYESRPAAAEDELPVHRISVTQEELAAAPRQTRGMFLHVVNGFVETGFFGREESPSKDWAFIDLDEYSGFDEFLGKIKKIQKGNAIRSARKSRDLGHYSKFFNEDTFVVDIAAVDQSTPERQGSAMTEHYLRTVEERGGYPKEYMPPPEPDDTLFWDRHWGTFRAEPGHSQGELVVDERLLAYCKFRRVGPFTFYGTILGHADHLDEGVVYRMHLDLVEHLFEQRARSATGDDTADRSLEGIRYLGYARYFNQGEGLKMWKRRMGFRPGYFLYDYPNDSQ